MDSYLIHIYRRGTTTGTAEKEDFYGVVEGIEQKTSLPFTNASELWQLLTGTAPITGSGNGLSSHDNKNWSKKK